MENQHYGSLIVCGCEVFKYIFYLKCMLESFCFIANHVHIWPHRADGCISQKIADMPINATLSEE